MNNHLVYCVAAPDERTYEAARAANDRFWKGHSNTRVRDQYPCTGWTMDELVGSQWVNIYTGGMETISHITIDRWDKAQLIPLSDVKRGDFGLGLWHGDRYVIDHWVRYDVLTPEEQLTWKVRRVMCCQQQVDRANEDYQRHRKGPANANSKKHWLRHERQTLKQALDDLQAFCSQHGFAPGTEYVNAGINQSAEPVQMRLFI